MDEKEGHSRVGADPEHSAVTEKLDMIEGRIHDTVEGTKSTINSVMDSIQHAQTSIEGTKSAIDNVLETIKFAMDETVERVKYTTDLIEQVNKNPWIMFGSAVLMGYVLSTVGANALPDRRDRHDQRQQAVPAGRTESHSYSPTS
jgi:phage-related protein